jgi:hypothetical protein
MEFFRDLTFRLTALKSLYPYFLGRKQVADKSRTLKVLNKYTGKVLQFNYLFFDLFSKLFSHHQWLISDYLIV